MRIHTDATPEQIRAAVRASNAVATVLTFHSSRTHARGVEIHLEGESRRRPNGGSKGDGGSGYAATWDQWGVALAGIFRADPASRAGSAKHPTYADRADFDAKTSDRFAQPGFPADYHGDHRFVPIAPYVQGCVKCSAEANYAPDAEPNAVASAGFLFSDPDSQIGRDAARHAALTS